MQREVALVILDSLFGEGCTRDTTTGFTRWCWQVSSVVEWLVHDFRGLMILIEPIQSTDSILMQRYVNFKMLTGGPSVAIFLG